MNLVRLPILQKYVYIACRSWQDWFNHTFFAIFTYKAGVYVCIRFNYCSKTSYHRLSCVFVFKKNLNASKPSEHPHQGKKCLIKT